jgi:hypothetical protein
MANQDNTANPASRLYRIMNQLRTFDKGDPEEEKRQSLVSVWLAVLDADPKDPNALADKLRQVRGLYEESLVGLRILPGLEKDEIKDLLSPIAQLLNPANFNYIWKGMKQSYLTPGVLVALELCSLRFQQAPSAPVDEKALDQLQKDIAALIHDTSAAQIGPVMKENVVQNLDLIGKAIAEDRAGASFPLRSALEVAVGRFYLYAGKYKESMPADLFGRFASVIEQFTRVVLTADKGWQLAGGGPSRLAPSVP